MVVARARKLQRFLSQPFHVAEVFTGSPGEFVQLEDTVKGFRAIVDGEHDDLPEAAFYMVGSMEQVIAKARKSVANFKLREGYPIGCYVTLRREAMYEFF